MALLRLLADVMPPSKAALRKTPSYLLTPAALATKLSRTQDETGEEGPPTWFPAAHLRLLDRKLRALKARRITRLVIVCPPRHGKSELCSHWLPVWWLALSPRERVMLLSYADTFARGWGRKVRDTIEDRADMLPVEVMVDENARSSSAWETVSGGGMVSTSAQGAVTGRGANLLVIDDPYKNREEAESERVRRKVWENFEGTLRTRLAPNAVMLVIQTRWHEDDLAGRLIARGWPSIRLPMLADHRDVLGREIPPGGELDPLERELGAALWPEMYDEKAAAEIHEDVGDYIWGALYQGLPSPLEGGGLWQRAQMDAAFRRFIEWGEPNVFSEVVVGVDPSGGTTDAGIIVAGSIRRNPDPPQATPKRGVVLADRTSDKRRWSQDAVAAYHEFRADRIVAEKNYGGEMVREVIEAIDPSIQVDLVQASRGKRPRAEPIHKLYEKEQVAHAERFPELETECVRWEPEVSMDSPNRMDALVWALDALEIYKKPREAFSVSGIPGEETDLIYQKGDLTLIGSKYHDKDPRD